MNSILKAEQISKNYRDGDRVVPVIHSVDMEINKGDFVSIQGVSGAGKSTFLSILGAILMPDSGEVFVNGKKLNDYAQAGKLHEYRKNHIGFVFQNHYLMPDFTALENVMLPLIIKRTKTRVAKEMAMEILDKVGLKDRAGHYPSQLSGGESQRVAVARAVVHKPDIILADEPTGNLDSHNTQVFIKILRDLQLSDKLTILVVTHETDLASVAQRRYYMKDGFINPVN